jgi:hypothetical protein
MGKKQVSFFDRVRIREIPLLSYDDEWSCDFHDSEFEYQMDLERDFGDYHEALIPEEIERGSLCGMHSSNNHIVDFSGKIYNSSSSHNNFRPLDPQLMKSDRWKSTKADRWKSTTSPKSDEPQDQPTTIPSSSSSSSLSNSETKRSTRTRSAGSCSIDFHKRMGRIKEEDHYFQHHETYLPVPQRRTSSTESLTRWGSGNNINSSSSSSNPSKYWKKTSSASAPSLRRLKLNRSRNNAPNNNLYLAGSRNATFGISNNNSDYSNNRPPILPTRRKNNIFLSSTTKINSNSVNNNKIVKKENSFTSIFDSSTSSHTSANTSDNDEVIDDDENKDNYDSDNESSASPEKDKQQDGLLVPESPSGSTNRRSLLSRGFGSLRSLRSMSPLSRRKGRNDDLPPKRPIRTSSMRKLLIEDIS